MKWFKKKPKNPYKTLRNAVYQSVIFIGFGMCFLAIPLTVWFESLFSPKYQMLTLSSSRTVLASFPIRITHISLLTGLLLIFFGFVYLKFAFKNYENKQWMDY